MFRPDKQATAARLIIAVLTVAFAFGIAHSLEPDHDSHAGSDCLACQWAQALYLGLFYTLLLSLLLAGLRARAADASFSKLILFASPGRAPPVR